MKIVINRCYGGFGLSKSALRRLFELGADPEITDCDILRNDPLLVRVVEELGEEAGGPYSKLKIVEIPDGTKWEITECDGMEQVEEIHNYWS